MRSALTTSLSPVVVLVLDTVVVVRAVSVLEQHFRLQPERITRLPLAVAVLLLQ